MISGVTINRAQVFADARGAVMRMLSASDANFSGFGEVYFSTVNPGAIKAWKRHRKMTMTLAVPAGRVLLVIYDDRPESPTCGGVCEIELGPHDYQVVTIPQMLWTGFMGLGDQQSVLCNCASIPHDPGESDARDIEDQSCPYRWPQSGSR
jgi:dTDP-4-dehydrorhamnose 3,5-epimerase